VNYPMVHVAFVSVNIDKKEITMPQNSQDSMKGTSPSPLIQRVVDQSWGQQNKGGDAPGVLDKAFNKNPVPPGDTKKTA
jgi:hypothetical protein